MRLNELVCKAWIFLGIYFKILSSFNFVLVITMTNIYHVVDLVDA